MSSQSHQYLLPSKTFFLGEYLALEKGPSIIHTGAPFFSLTIIENNSARCDDIHPDSPAGRFIRDHFQLRKNEVLFSDPHHQRGGFGASSAQFAGAYQHVYGFSSEPAALKKLLDCYRYYANTNAFYPPSGADVIAQLCGDISIFDERDFTLEKIQWPFHDIDIEIIHTGKKLATHKHLQQLDNIPQNDLREITLNGIAALKNQHSNEFLKSINDYYKALCELQWMSPKTQQLIEKISQKKPFLAAKGCGAMGMDTIVIFRKKA